MINYINIIKNNYNKLIFVIDKSFIENIKEKTNYKCINLNISLTKRLLEYPIKKIGSKVGKLTQDIISMYDDEVIIINGLEVLFTNHLNVSCIELLKLNSRNRILIVEWPGEYENDTLIYAKGHIEEFKYKVNNEFIVIGG